MSAEPFALRDMVVNALRLTALPAEKQVAALPGFVHVPDEIALIYGDAFGLVPQLREAEVITERQADALRDLDQQFAEMTGAPDRAVVWTVEAMQTDVRWGETRRLAAHALTLLGASAGPPQFGMRTWVRG